MGETTPLDRLLATLTGLGLRDPNCFAPGAPGPMDCFLPELFAPLARVAEGCLAMPVEPIGAGASISSPSIPLEAPLTPWSASTASSRTAGTVDSKGEPWESCDNREALCERVCWIG